MENVTTPTPNPEEKNKPQKQHISLDEWIARIVLANDQHLEALGIVVRR